MCVPFEIFLGPSQFEAVYLPHMCLFLGGLLGSDFLDLRRVVMKKRREKQALHLTDSHPNFKCSLLLLLLLLLNLKEGLTLALNLSNR